MKALEGKLGRVGGRRPHAHRARHRRPGGSGPESRHPRPIDHAHRRRSPVHESGLRRSLQVSRIRRSMSAVDSNADSALAESCNATFKRETLQNHKNRPNQPSDPTRRRPMTHPLQRPTPAPRPGHSSPITYETALETPPTTLTPATQTVFRVREQGPDGQRLGQARDDQRGHLSAGDDDVLLSHCHWIDRRLQK